jgi:hypothetical protein
MTKIGAFHYLPIVFCPDFFQANLPRLLYERLDRGQRFGRNSKKAMEEGIPYQTLISIIPHNYASGRLA